MDDQIELNGTESALLVAAVFILGNWPFESPAARAMLTNADRSLAEVVGDRISARWRSALSSAGLWDSPTGQWTPDLIAKRGELEHGLQLERDELPMSVLALRSCAIEFADSWGKFCVAAPGAVDWYGVGSAALEHLAERLIILHGS